MRALIVSLPIALAVLALPCAARAQQAAADALFDSARTAMTKGDFASACEQFRASDKLDPAVGTELNLADCEEKRGRLASAWELYRTVEEKLAANDERLALAHSHAQALEPRVPKLTLTLEPGAPKTSTVRIDGVDLGSAAFGVALPLDPGAHDLVVSAPGFQPSSTQITLGAGQSEAHAVSPSNRAISTNLARSTSAAAATTTEPRTPSAAQHVGTNTRTLGFVLGGVGMAGLGVGAVAGILELGKQHAVENDCHADKSCSSAGLSAAQSGRTLEKVSNIGWVVGAAALGAGAYFLLTSGPSTEPTTSVALSTGPTGGRVSLSRSW